MEFVLGNIDANSEDQRLEFHDQSHGSWVSTSHRGMAVDRDWAKALEDITPWLMRGWKVEDGFERKIRVTVVDAPVNVRTSIVVAVRKNCFNSCLPPKSGINLRFARVRLRFA